MKVKITENEIKEAILNNSLGLNEFDVINLLKHFNLVFEIDEERKTYFIPQYLPNQTKAQETFEKLGFSFCNIIIMADHYLMSLAMLKIFSKYGNYVDKDKNEYLFWQNGIVILKDNQTLLIKYITQKQSIELYASKDDNKLLQKEVVDFILDLPESYELPKRNFENHVKKRWLDVLDEEDEDFSPHFSERIDEYPGYYEDFINKNWKNNYQWQSSYFDVLVSTDGEYFIEWKELKKNEGLSELNFVNQNGILKKQSDVDYSYLIDKKIQMEDKKDKSITVNFNAPVNAGIIGNDGTIENYNVIANSSKQNETIVFSEEDKSQAVKNWKKRANLIFFSSLLITLFLILIYIFELNFIMNNSEWAKFKKSEWIKWIGIIFAFFWNSFIGKMCYDRNFDPSKEKAFIELQKTNK